MDLLCARLCGKELLTYTYFSQLSYVHILQTQKWGISAGVRVLGFGLRLEGLGSQSSSPDITLPLKHQPLFASPGTGQMPSHGLQSPLTSTCPSECLSLASKVYSCPGHGFIAWD